MELKQYHEEALRTESVIPNISGVSVPHLYLLLSAAHSLGEMLDQFKKGIFYRKPIDINRFKKGLADLQDLIGTLSPESISADELHDDTNTMMMTGFDGKAHNIGLGSLGAIDSRILHASLGVFTESAEICKALVNTIEGQPLDLVNLSEEFGDLNWYSLGVFPSASGIHYGRILETNIVKLAVRYPEKFEAFLAHDENRNLVEERKALVNGIK